MSVPNVGKTKSDLLTDTTNLEFIAKLLTVNYVYLKVYTRFLRKDIGLHTCMFLGKRIMPARIILKLKNSTYPVAGISKSDATGIKKGIFIAITFNCFSCSNIPMEDIEYL